LHAFRQGRRQRTPWSGSIHFAPGNRQQKYPAGGLTFKKLKKSFSTPITDTIWIGSGIYIEKADRQGRG